MNTEMELSTINILSLFETDKEQRKSFIEDVINRVENGDADVLKVHLYIKKMEEIIKGLCDTSEKTNKNYLLAIKYKTFLLDAAQKYGSKSFELYNSKFETKEVGSKYDFTKCEDVEWEQLDAQVKSLNERIKSRETFLKTVPQSGLLITNEQTGETCKVYPPSKSSTTAVAVTLK